jgi:hypothetical protein
MVDDIVVVDGAVVVVAAKVVAIVEIDFAVLVVAAVVAATVVVVVVVVVYIRAVNAIAAAVGRHGYDAVGYNHLTDHCVVAVVVVVRLHRLPSE